MLAIIPLIIVLLIILAAMAVVITNIRIVPQTEKWIIERLGMYRCTWDAGIHCKIPFIDRIVNRVSTKEKVYDFPPQAVITKDNVTMHIDTVVYAIVTDAKLYTYGTDNPTLATETLAATTLRNIVGSMELDTTLTSREEINNQMTLHLDEATDPWGIKVKRVEIKTIQPPKDIQDAMEQQMKAERTKRARILDAEGEKRSAILRAEGVQESMVLQAKAEREAEILRAEADAKRRELEADAEAYYIHHKQEANASAIKMLNEARPSEKVIALKSLEALAMVADGQATKLIIPSDISSVAGLVTSIKECANTVDESKKKRNVKNSSREQQPPLFE